ncbi:MAG: branched-chain amino acid transport system substrate-binding protein, partial [Thermodesulfobacteriota bacterium]|nr:branched-chain amino acid transport system substrate-binding protein [Thermodesulfobacteriota bacterium]
KFTADNITNNWGFDHNLVRITGQAGEGTIGAASCAFLHMDVPYMDKVREYTQKVNPGVPMDKRDIRTVQGWLKVSLGAAGLQRADKKGNIDGPSLKAALESLRDWYPFETKNALGVGPYNITDKDHRPTPVASLYTIKDGKIVLFEKVNMKEKFPEQWPKWLGW